MENNTNTLSSTEIKAAKTDHDIHPLIEKRWSPRAFSEKAVSEAQLMQIFEAARWAASSRNEQPWLYTYALKGTEGFEKLWNCLNEGNQPWTKDAAVLFVAMKRNTFSSGKPNKTAEHDLGLANANLILQATSMDIYGHFMAGFSAEKVRETLELQEDVEPVCMGALGYLAEAETLEEPFKSREQKPRKRKPVEEFAQAL